MRKLHPPSYFAAALVSIAALHLVVPGPQLVAGWWRLAGLVPVALGMALNAKADGAFTDYATTVKPFEPSTALLTDGVFRITRNPMYLGMVLILAGAALGAGSTTPWLVVATFAVLMDRAFISPEERMLAEQFGDDFAAYKQAVRRWI